MFLIVVGVIVDESIDGFVDVVVFVEAVVAQSWAGRMHGRAEVVAAAVESLGSAEVLTGL